MSRVNIETEVENLVKPIINKLNYSVYDVQYVKEGRDYYLRITIDSPNGIGIADCENVNNAIDDLLDEVDIIKDSYFLEVSSPGIERVLRKQEHFESHIGKMINVKLFKPINKNKEFIGILKSYGEVFELDVDGEIMKFDLTDIALVKSVAEEF